MEECNNVPEEEKWWGNKTLHQINGFWFTPFRVPIIQRVLAEFKPRPNDVTLVSFPKTGTTWLKSLLYSIINRSSLDSLLNNNPHDLVPYLEVQVFGDHCETNSDPTGVVLAEKNLTQSSLKTNPDLTRVAPLEKSLVHSSLKATQDLTGVALAEKSLIQSSLNTSLDLSGVEKSLTQSSSQLDSGKVAPAKFDSRKSLTQRSNQPDSGEISPAEFDSEKSLTHKSNQLDSGEVAPAEFDSEKSLTQSFSKDTTKIFNTHIPYQLLGKALESSGCHVVYVARNPKDTLNSLWHFANKWKMAEEAPWELEEAVEKFLRGIVPAGPYYEHVLGYKMASLKNPSKVFFITYEELKDDTKTHVKRLAEFLGCPFGKDDDNEVEEIVKCCSIEVLKNHEVNKSENCPDWFSTPYNSFFRQGKVGDYRNYFSDEAIKSIDALTEEKFHKSGFVYGI